MSIVNPLSAVGLCQLALSSNATACVQTAAASQLGKMLIYLCKQENITLINIVRSEDQVQSLKEMGCEYVLN